jgi:hypothetical protein
MKGRRIEVISYSGYKGEERPLAYVSEGEKVEVTEVLRSWVEEEIPSRERLRCFSVKIGNGSIHVLCCNESTMEWSVKER